jgi:GTP-binding protein LepA
MPPNFPGATNIKPSAYSETLSSITGIAFPGGFLGMLHLEIVTERLHREFGSEVIATVPSVALLR